MNTMIPVATARPAGHSAPGGSTAVKPATSAQDVAGSTGQPGFAELLASLHPAASSPTRQAAAPEASAEPAADDLVAETGATAAEHSGDQATAMPPTAMPPIDEGMPLAPREHFLPMQHHQQAQGTGIPESRTPGLESPGQGDPAEGSSAFVRTIPSSAAVAAQRNAGHTGTGQGQVADSTMLDSTALDSSALVSFSRGTSGPATAAGMRGLVSPAGETLAPQQTSVGARAGEEPNLEANAGPAFAPAANTAALAEGASKRSGTASIVHTEGPLGHDIPVQVIAQNVQQSSAQASLQLPTPTALGTSGMAIAPVGAVAAAGAEGTVTESSAPAPLQRQMVGPIATLAAGPHGERTMSVNVAPEGLGPITVKAHIGSEGIRMDLSAPTEAGREALRAMLPELRRELAATGAGNITVGTSSDTGGSQQGSAAQQFGNQQHTPSGGLLARPGAGNPLLPPGGNEATSQDLSLAQLASSHLDVMA